MVATVAAAAPLVAPEPEAELAALSGLDAELAAEPAADVVAAALVTADVVAVPEELVLLQATSRTAAAARPMAHRPAAARSLRRSNMVPPLRLCSSGSGQGDGIPWKNTVIEDEMVHPGARPTLEHVEGTPIDFAAEPPRPRPIDVAWIHGSPSAKHNADPDIQTFDYDPHTVILRQNKAINYEAPFLFLLFGNSRAVLIDTGATASAEYFPLRKTVDALLDRWLADHPRIGYELLVLHTHPHGDHIAGDGQFAGRAGTIVVDADWATTRKYLRIRQRS